MPKMSDHDLKVVVAEHIRNAADAQGGRLAQERALAERYYRGERLGNELDGRSQVVSRDVAEAVDAMLPSLMKIFAGGDEVVRFEPVGPEDEEAARQATDYVNWIWNRQNDGFSVFYGWFKDALLKKVGIVKIWWDEGDEARRETYEGLSDAEWRLVAEDPSIEIVGHRDYPDPMMLAVIAAAPPAVLQGAADAVGAGGADAEAPPDGHGGAAPPASPVPLLHDCIVRRKRRVGRVRIMPVPPEEFLIARGAASLDEAGFVAHRVKRTVSDLLAMGYPRAKVLALESDGALDFAPERLQRFADEGGLLADAAALDPAMRSVSVTECWLKVDADGDGIAELRHVTVAGEGDMVLLENEETDGHPFAALCPNPLPHRFWGLSVADQTLDLQLVKTTLWRGALDSLYLANAPQLGVLDGKVNVEDLLNRRPGGIVRMKEAGALMPIATQPVSGEAFQMIEYLDTVREQRTGITRYNQGLDADTLNKTATGINAIQSASQQRLELIARIFAETGVKRAFKRVLELVAKHQQAPRIIRLRNRWVAMDPRGWSDEMDLTVTVGLGTGNRDQQVLTLLKLLDLDERIVALQGGVAGPLVTARNVYNKLVKLVEAAGLKSAESYYSDPGTALPAPPAPPPPDPMLALAAMEREMAELKARIAAEAEIAKAKIQAEAQIEVAEIRSGHDYSARVRGQDLEHARHREAAARTP
jgi:hypothetical protein